MAFVVTVLGATGATGKPLTRLLVENNAFAEVRVLVRRETEFDGVPQDSTKLRQIVVEDFAAATDEQLDHAYTGADAVVCVLGTTRAAAGSAARFREIDHDIPVAHAKAAHDRGVRHYHLLTSLGASSSSRALYPRTKGENERDTAALGFQAHVSYQPSLLLRGKDARGVETVASALLTGVGWMFFGSARNYKSTTVETLATGIAQRTVELLLSPPEEPMQEKIQTMAIWDLAKKASSAGSADPGSKADS